MRTVRTDLAMESYSSNQHNTRGVRINTQEEQGIKQTTVYIDTLEAAQRLMKSCGVFVTILSDQLPHADCEMQKRMASQISRTLCKLLPQEGDVMVIGLGNRHVTADALGAKVVEGTLVTRHLKDNVNHELLGRLRGVCAVAPGVLGVTGMETAEVVKGLVERIHPCAIIAIDALAAMACERICTTIQITDTGISPGSGVGNHRLGLTKETLGVPVIAIGVPMVVYAATIAKDALAILSEEMLKGSEQHEAVLDALFDRLNRGQMGEMIVTPREIDELVQHIAQILAMGINMALQPRLNPAEIPMLMH
ncbi:MAG: GPR endopeptidase [Clostridia bacterium]|nr:GPR endopeptidase [Clostridia bacterium]